MSTIMSKNVTVTELPYRLLLEHWDTMSAMAVGGLRSVLPLKRKHTAPVPVQRTVNPPSPQLLQAYRDWCHAANSRGIPPHLVCAKLTMPVVADLTAQSPYPLLSVLNQGVRLQLHKPIPEGEALELKGELLDASDDGYRARIHSRVTVSTASAPNAMTIDAIAAVMLKKRPGGDSDKNRVEPDYVTIDQWQAAWNEGQTFFWLTGDFNPIHTVPALAKRTQFKGCIMHGYGAFAQVYEALQRSGARFKEIETRFVRPLPLPSGTLLIQQAKTPDEDGQIAFRLINETGTLYQAGRYVPAAESRL
ncbi:MAG TPA: MaoC family dehydratase [Dongiaceae bacterium]|nr:MaoC family dehydratase [Dongiaceae bacterium]